MLLKEKRGIKILYLNDLVQPRITRTLKYAKEKKSGKQIWKGYRKKTTDVAGHHNRTSIYSETKAEKSKKLEI